jgi:dephospho-CoA kinase
VVRIGRLMARDNTTREEILKRFRAQLPADKKREKGDFVIMNEGPVSTLVEKVQFLDMLLARMAS